MPNQTPDVSQQSPGLKELIGSVSPWDKPQKVVAKGSVVAFGYTGQGRGKIHDPFPLIIVSDIFSDEVRGVNLHYLTLPYVKGLIQTYGSNQKFSYSNIKADTYIQSAFRSYKRGGITQLRMLDTAFLQKLMKIVRALAPGEIEQMRSQVQNMIKQGPSQPKAQAGEQVSKVGPANSGDLT